MTDKEKRISRKEFFKKSGVGLTGAIAFNAMGKSPIDLLGSTKKPAQTVVLGRSGIKVNPIGFGAARTMEPSLVKTAIDHGLNFLDTGRLYARGNNEIMVGKVIKDIRKDVVIQSKIKVPVIARNKTVRPASSIAGGLEDMLNESLKALQTDYIDIMLVHETEDIREIQNETVMEFLDSAKKNGIIRAHGFSFHCELEHIRYANSINFYDIIVNPFNHKGAYKHMLHGEEREWDQPQLAVELKKAHDRGVGTVALKTCSAGPYSFNGEEASFPGAIKWVLNNEFIDAVSAAMSNVDEIKADCKALS
ncbi:aldo/keto reductase [candidate division KSB1 bacterium]